ncbi:hypothetical protein C3V36_07130 [Lachnospiraceae bacterium oral taxon 500]|nr:hypothetical protein C3V36_07130 [Lachnospiraceae bacterium oral taxon 500]
MNFIYGKNCTLGYEDEYGNHQEQELKNGEKYKITLEAEAEYVEFKGDDLIFEVAGIEVSIPMTQITKIEEK